MKLPSVKKFLNMILKGENIDGKTFLQISADTRYVRSFVTALNLTMKRKEEAIKICELLRNTPPEFLNAVKAIIDHNIKDQITGGIMMAFFALLMLAFGIFLISLSSRIFMKIFVFAIFAGTSFVLFTIVFSSLSESRILKELKRILESPRRNPQV